MFLEIAAGARIFRTTIGFPLFSILNANSFGGVLSDGDVSLAVDGRTVPEATSVPYSGRSSPKTCAPKSSFWIVFVDAPLVSREW